MKSISGYLAGAIKNNVNFYLIMNMNTARTLESYLVLRSPQEVILKWHSRGLNELFFKLGLL